MADAHPPHGQNTSLVRYNNVNYSSPIKTTLQQLSRMSKDDNSVVVTFF